jgi:hypothetical protein
MAQMYRDGTGVEQSYEMARILYELAAQQGDASAMSHLGALYVHGEGVEQSYEKAFEYYEQAAQLGFAQAQLNLGFLYITGQGVERSPMKARELWVKAAGQGDDLAIKHLARLNKLDELLQQVASSSLDDVLVCSTCGSSAPVSSKFKNCPCGSARYCNKTCQKKHWKEHRNKCKRLLKDRKQ